MTKLTKAMREEIAANVLKATTLFDERDKLAAELKLACIAYLRSQQPPEFLALTDGKPKEWFSTKNYLQVRTSLGSLSGLLHPENENRNWAVTFDDSVVVAADLNYHFTVDEDDKDFKKFFGAVAKRVTTWRATHDETIAELRAVLHSASTVEKLLERMPELRPHIPKAAAPSMPLVATSNVLSRLTKLGFDRTQQVQA